MKKNRIIIIGAVSIILIIVCIKCVFVPGSKEKVKIETVRVSANKISATVTATGTIQPITEVTVGTQVSGKVAKIYVDYNSAVKKGQVLAEIDKTNLQTAYNTQQLGVQSSKVEYDYQKKNYGRARELHEQNLISETDYETAKYSFEKAESAYKQNLSNLDKAKTDLGYATIYSPIDGVVLSRAVEEGQTVAASFSTPTMFIIARDLTKMQVVANVDEADIGNVKVNQHVTFTVDAYTDDTFEGTITQVRLNPTTTSNVVTYQVIVNAPNPDFKLKPGLTANITIYTLEKDNVKTVPNKALSFKPDTASLHQNGFTIENVISKKEFKPNEKAIWVQSGKTLKKKLIEIGQSDASNTEVISGLTESDSIVTDVTELVAGALSANKESSPFMPKRPGFGGRKNK